MSNNILEFIAEASMKDTFLGYLRSALGRKKPSEAKPKPTYSTRVKKTKKEEPFKWEHLNPAKATRREVMKAKAAYVLGAAHDGFNAGKAAGAAEAKKASVQKRREQILDKKAKQGKSKQARARGAAKKLDSPIERAELKAKAKPDSWHAKFEKEKASKLKRVLKKKKLTPGALKAAQVLTARADQRKPK